MEPIMHAEALWSLEDIRAYFRYEETQARKIVSQPGFPSPLRPLGPSSHPRWVAGEVWAWARQKRAA